MNILDKITTLKEERGGTEYKIAEQSGITKSTISTWYRRIFCLQLPLSNRYVKHLILHYHNSFWIMMKY